MEGVHLQTKHISPQRLVLILLALVLAALAVVVYFADSLEKRDSVGIAEVHEAGLGALTLEGLATQAFPCDRNGLSAIEVMYSNYNRKVQNGSLTLTLEDEAGQEIARQEWTDLSALKNYVYIQMSFPAQENSAGRSYTLRAASDCTDQRGITLRMGQNAAEGYRLTLADGTEAEGQSLCLRLTYATPSRGTLAAATLLLIALCVAAVIPLSGRKEAQHA